MQMSTATPIVTVIVPVAESHVHLLPDVLKSVARQTVNVAQVLIANDSHSPIDPGRWPFRVGVVNTGGGKWTSVARNMALARANTPFVSFLDADDAYTTTALESMLRAYKMWRVGYVYGDAIVLRQGKTDYVPAYEYDRRLLGMRNIHTVSALVPTAYAKAVGGFDESLRGWEDWEFYIRLAEAGYCGKRVPHPTITYRLDTGQNRSNSEQIKQLIDYIRGRHDRFVKGVFDMGCCGGDAAAQAAISEFGVPMPMTEDGKVMMEYTGDRQAPVTFNANGRQYRVSTTEGKFFNAEPADVAKLMSLGWFQLAPMPASKPAVHEFETSMDVMTEMAPFSAEDSVPVKAKLPEPKVTRPGK